MVNCATTLWVQGWCNSTERRGKQNGRRRGLQDSLCPPAIPFPSLRVLSCLCKVPFDVFLCCGPLSAAAAACSSKRRCADNVFAQFFWVVGGGLSAPDSDGSVLNEGLFAVSDIYWDAGHHETIVLVSVAYLSYPLGFLDRFSLSRGIVEFSGRLRLVDTVSDVIAQGLCI